MLGGEGEEVQSQLAEHVWAHRLKQEGGEDDDDDEGDDEDDADDECEEGGQLDMKVEVGDSVGKVEGREDGVDGWRVEPRMVQMVDKSTQCCTVLY